MMIVAFVTVIASMEILMSSTNGNVIPHEVYPTPSKIVRSLMSLITFRSTDKFLEPCIGHGNIMDEIPLPPNQRYSAEIRHRQDYLTTEFPTMDVIITNPPFSLTTEFLTKSKSELAPDGTLIYLQRLNFLGSIKRVHFWNKFTYPHKIIILVPRPRFVYGRSDSNEYAWFVWDYGNRLPNLPPISNIVSI